MDALVVAPARDVALGGHGVEMAGEQHGSAAPHEQAGVAEVGDVEEGGHVGRQALLVARLGGDVDELERPSGQPVAEARHAAARRASSVWTSGATSVPKRSIERMTARCSTSPAAICAR